MCHTRGVFCAPHSFVCPSLRCWDFTDRDFFPSLGEVQLPQFITKIVEESAHNRTVEQIVMDSPTPQTQEETVAAFQSTPQERISVHMAEHHPTRAGSAAHR